MGTWSVRTGALMGVWDQETHVEELRMLLSAPRGALTYPPCSGEGLEETSLGPWLTWTRKTNGKAAWHPSRLSCPGVPGEEPAGPRDMPKARLPEAQAPDGATSHPAERRLEPVPALAAGSTATCSNPPGLGRCPVRPFKEMSGPPKSRSIRMAGSPRRTFSGAWSALLRE